jgi:hypothetical protein
MVGRRYVLSVCLSILDVLVPGRAGLGGNGTGQSPVGHRLASSHSLEEGAAAIDMHGQSSPVLLHRHSRIVVKFSRMLLQQLDAVIVQPLGAFNDAPQISCMGRSIMALEVFSCETGDDGPRISIARGLPVSHGCFPKELEQARRRSLTDCARRTRTIRHPMRSGGPCRRSCSIRRPSWPHVRRRDFARLPENPVGS